MPKSEEIIELNEDLTPKVGDEEIIELNDDLTPKGSEVKKKSLPKEEALNAVVAKSQAGYINPDLEDFNKPQVEKQTAKKDTPIDDLVLTNKTLRQMRNFSDHTTKKSIAELDRIQQEGIALRDQYNSNPSYDLEQKMFSKEVEYQAAKKKANLSALQTEVYNRRLMETSESIKKMANDKVPDGIYSAIYKGIKGSVKDTEKAIEMSQASKAEQIQWAKDEALKAPTQEQGVIEQGAEMVGGVIPDIATSIGFSLVGLPAVGVGAVSARQGAQQAGQDFVRAFNAAQEEGKNDDEAYEIATKAAGIGFATGAAEGLVGAATGHLGAKLASKATSKVAAKVVEKAVDTGLDATIAGSMQVGRNVFDRYQGLKTDISEGVAQNMLGEVLLSGPVNTYHGVQEYVSAKNKDGVKKSIEDIYQAVKEQPENPYKLQKLQENIEVLKQSGGISEADYNTLKTRVAVVQKEFEAGASLKEAAKVSEREEKKEQLTAIIKDGDNALVKISEVPAETPFEKAEQEVLITKVKESQKAAFEELKNIATEQIDEFEGKKTGVDSGVVEPQEVKVQSEGSGVGGDVGVLKDGNGNVMGKGESKIIEVSPDGKQVKVDNVNGWHPIELFEVDRVKSTSNKLENLSEKDFDKLTPSQKVSLYKEHGITKEDGSPITEKDIENSPLQYSYDFMASSESGKWNSANSELESLVKDHRKAYSLYKMLIGDNFAGDNNTFKDIVDYINNKTDANIEYTDRMRRADETMSAEERQAAVDSYNKSAEGKTEDKVQKEKDILEEHGLADETEYSPHELVEKFPLKGVQKVIWDIIKPIVEKLGIKVKFSSSRITEGFDGSNNPMNGEILLRPSTLKNGRLGEVLVHEVVHSLTTKIISRVNSGVETGLTGKQVAAVKGLNKLYKSIEADNNLQNKYPVKDIFEFIAHLTNDSFVKELESKDRNFIQKVVDYISDILGLSNANELAKKYLKDIIHDGTFLEKEGITVVSSDYAANVKGAEGLTPKQRLLEAIKNNSKTTAEKYHDLKSKGKENDFTKAVEQSLPTQETKTVNSEQIKSEKERLKTLVTAIEKKQPYDKKEVAFFNSDESALFKKSGVPVELQVALEESKPKAKVQTERQETINKIVELADQYNKLWKGRLGRETEDGRALLNRIRTYGEQNGFVVTGGGSKANVVVKNSKGSNLRAKYESSSNKAIVEDYIPLAERDFKVVDVFHKMNNYSIHSFPTVLNEYGNRFSLRQMQNAVADIQNNVASGGAKRVLDALDEQVTAGKILIDDPIMGRQSVSLDEYMESLKEDFAEERAVGIEEQAALAKEYDQWFNTLTNDEKNKQLESFSVGSESGTESTKDVADQTSSIPESQKRAKTIGDNKSNDEEAPGKKEVLTNKSESNEKRNEKTQRGKEGLLGPGKKFYSYLVSQGMSKVSAALNTAVFNFSVARRAMLMGKPVSEVMSEYKFGDSQLSEGVKGVWRKEQGQRILSVFQNAKNTTAVHEALGHDYLDTIIQAAMSGHKESSEDIDVVIREYKKDNRFTPTTFELRKQLEGFDVENMDRERDSHAISIHEWFAEKAVEYMANPEMRGASPRLKKLFQKFIIYLKDLHNTLAGRKVSEPMRKIFQKAFGEDYDIAQEAIEVEMDEVADIEEVSTPVDELFNNLLDVSNNAPQGAGLFDAAFDEKKSKETLIALAQKLILEGNAVKDVIPTIKNMVENSNAPVEQKEFLSKLIDKSAADMILDPPVELGANKATRRGIQKMLKNPDVPEVLKNLVRKNKDILEYKPISFAEGDAVADAAIKLYGLDVVDKWIKKMLKGNKPEQVYAARVYKKLLEAQTTLANKYAAEGNETLFESTLENWNLDIENAGKLSTSVAQQLVMFRGVFGHPELAVRAIQQELTNTQKAKIAKRDKIREMLKEAFDKLEITNDELLQKTFELEETNEQLQDKIKELENETRSRAAAPKGFTPKAKVFDDPGAIRKQAAAELKALRAARGLKDADTEAEVLRKYSIGLFFETGKAYKFPQYAKIAREDIGDLTDEELAVAYKHIRDEHGFPLDSDETIGALLHKKIVKDEELAAAKAEKIALKRASKAKRDAIASAKKSVLDKLKEAGFKRGDHVDWRKIATERMNNPEKAAEIINTAVEKAGGLTVAEKLKMNLEMLAKLDETIREHKAKLVEQVLKDNDVTPNKKNKGDIDRLVALLNTLSEESSPVGFKKALNKLLGIESVSIKDLKRLRELGNNLQVEELRMERQAILNEMYYITSKYSGSRAARIMADMYYADMLSGLITQLKNSTNRFNIWSNLLGAYISSGGDKNLLEVAKKSKNRGILMSTLQRGISISRTHLGENFYGNSLHVSEFEYFRERSLRNASGKLTLPTVGKGVFDRTISLPKYVSRSLDGIDGENWIRMYDQAQYRFMVRMFKSRGFTDEVARDKAADIMISPMGELEAMEKATKIYSTKNVKVSDATLRRAAYDLIQQAREKQAAENGIENLEEIGTALANWITFKGDAYGPTELIPAISRSTVKGLNYLSDEFGKPENGKAGKALQFLVNAIRIINIPFVNGVARIVTRGLESALGVGFAKSWYQYSRAKDETGVEREMAIYQAQETLNSAIGSTIAFYVLIHGLVAISQALYDDEKDEWASGFYSKMPSDNPAVRSRPGYALHIFGVWIPFGWLGTFAIPAAVSGAVSDYFRMKKLSGDEQKFMIALNTINTVLGSSFLQTQNNFKDYVSDVLKGGDVSGKTEEAIIRGSASVAANVIPLKSFFNQASQMFTNAEDKEARTFVQNIVKYSIGGIGLKPRIDYMGRIVKAGKKNPESAAGVPEMFNEWGYDDRDKMIASFGSDFPLWNRSQKTLYFNERPISDDKYYDFQKKANTYFGQYMRSYLSDLKVATDPKGLMSDKTFRGTVIKELHSLANRQAMSDMFITGENKKEILPEQTSTELSEIEELFK